MLKVGTHLFDGPYEDFSTLQEKPGVYVIVCYQSPFYFPIDCGVSKNVRDSVETHKGAFCLEAQLQNRKPYGWRTLYRCWRSR